MATMGVETKGDIECDSTGIGLTSVRARRDICVAEGSVLISDVRSA